MIRVVEAVCENLGFHRSFCALYPPMAMSLKDLEIVWILRSDVIRLTHYSKRLYWLEMLLTIHSERKAHQSGEQELFDGIDLR